jgi:hypothetical protein
MLGGHSSSLRFLSSACPRARLWRRGSRRSVGPLSRSRRPRNDRAEDQEQQGERAEDGVFPVTPRGEIDGCRPERNGHKRPGRPEYESTGWTFAPEPRPSKHDECGANPNEHGHDAPEPLGAGQIGVGAAPGGMAQGGACRKSDLKAGDSRESDRCTDGREAAPLLGSSSIRRDAWGRGASLSTARHGNG